MAPVKDLTRQYTGSNLGTPASNDRFFTMTEVPIFGLNGSIRVLEVMLTEKYEIILTPKVYTYWYTYTFDLYLKENYPVVDGAFAFANSLVHYDYK